MRRRAVFGIGLDSTHLLFVNETPIQMKLIYYLPRT